MDSFYVYDSWARDRARIHRGACANCNFGRGMMPTPSAQHGRWHGPFYDRDEALLCAERLGRADVAACPKCRP